MYLYPRGKTVAVLVGGDGFTKVEVPPVSFANCKNPVGEELTTFVRRLLGTFYYQGFTAKAANVRLGIDGLYYTTLEVAVGDKQARAIDMYFGYRSVISDEGYLAIEPLDLKTMGKENLIPPAITASATFAIDWNYSGRSTEIMLDITGGYERAALVTFERVTIAKDVVGEYLVQSVPSIYSSRVGATCVAKVNITHDETGSTVMVYPLRSWIDNLRALGLTNIVRASFGFNGITASSGGGKWDIKEIASAQITALILDPWVAESAALSEGHTVASELKPVAVEHVDEYSARKQAIEYPRLYPLSNNESVLQSHVATATTALGEYQYGFLKTGSFDLLGVSQCARQNYDVAPDVVVARLMVQAESGEPLIIEPKADSRFTFYPEYGQLGFNDAAHNQQREYVLRGTDGDDRDVMVTFRGRLGNLSGTGTFGAEIINDKTLKVIGWEPIAYGMARVRWVTGDHTPNLAENLQDIAYGAYLSGLPEDATPRTREQFVDGFPPNVHDMTTAFKHARGMAADDAKVFTSDVKLEAKSIAISGTMMRSSSPTTEQ